jgi:outer membrane protein OmpA-like peptidoglycan-associated protein
MARPTDAVALAGDGVGTMSESTQTEAVHPLDQSAAGADEHLRELRGLLIGPEMEQIAAIRHRLDDPEARSVDLSSSIAEAITIRAKKDGKLQRALHPLLEESLRVSVARDPGMIATALFPIIGEAVRKAVAHALQGMFDSLNLMLNRGLSMESWKWRLEAWRTGKSFGQIALTRSLTYRVEQVFLVHRKTGLLIGQASFDDGVVQDADLISGMLTAVQDFVRDSFAREKTDDLQVMEVGQFKVWLQHGPLALLASVVSGQPPPELREVFERELEAIHRDFGAALESFDGDTAELAGAEVNLRRCLLGQQKPVKRKSSRAVWVIFVLILLAIAALVGLRVRDNRRWAQYLERLHNEPGIIVVDAQRHWFGYAVNGLRDPLAVYPPTLLDAYRVPAKKVSERWEPYLSLDPAFAVTRQLETEKAVVERQVIRFDLNSAQLPMSQFDTLDTAAESIVKLREMAAENGQRVAIKIDGHTDPTGAEDRNKQLSEARAQTVATLLLRRGVTPDMLNTEGLADSRPEHAGDATYPVELNRRVTFQVFLVPASSGAAK